MIRNIRLVVFAAYFMLNGCVAAPVVAVAFSAAVTGWFVYRQVNMGKDATASIKIQRNDPSPEFTSLIRQARSLAIYPGRDGNDGSDIDEYRKNTDLEITSSARTLAYAEKNKLPEPDSLPSDDKRRYAAKLARDHSADLGLIGFITDQSRDVNMFSASAKQTVEYTVKLVHAKSSKLLWEEDHEIVIKGIKTGNISSQEISALVVGTISDRIMDIRLGRDAKEGEGDRGTFSAFRCGGKLNPFCDGKEEDSSGGKERTYSTEPMPNNKVLVREIQAELGSMGYYSGAIDGLYGPRTRAAISEYQSSQGLSATGQPTEALLVDLQEK